MNGKVPPASTEQPAGQQPRVSSITPKAGESLWATEFQTLWGICPEKIAIVVPKRSKCKDTKKIRNIKQVYLLLATGLLFTKPSQVHLCPRGTSAQSSPRLHTPNTSCRTLHESFLWALFNSQSKPMKKAYSSLQFTGEKLTCRELKWPAWEGHTAEKCRMIVGQAVGSSGWVPNHCTTSPTTNITAGYCWGLILPANRYWAHTKFPC